MATTLLPNETVIMSSNDDRIILSNYRVTQNAGDTFVSIGLDKISCIKIHYTSTPIYLIVGVIFGLAGVVLLFDQVSRPFGVLVVLIGVGLIALYLKSREHLVSIYSDSGQSLDFGAAANSKVKDFLNKVEGARIECVKGMNAFSPS